MFAATIAIRRDLSVEMNGGQRAAMAPTPTDHPGGARSFA